MAQAILALACCAGSQSACLTTRPLSYDFDVSAAIEIPRGLAGKIHGSGEAELHFPNFTLKVSALDATVKRQAVLSGVPMNDRTDPGPIPSFMLLVVFEPSRLGVSFDPMQASIETEDGSLLRPVSYVGPGSLGFDRDRGGCLAPLAAWSQAPEQLPRRTEARSWPLPLGTACFVVAFATHVRPPHGVAVAVGEVRSEGRPVSIPAMRFFRRPAGALHLNQRPAALP